MTVTEAVPIACTLTPGEYKDRLASIGELTRDALRGHERHDLTLELHYAPEARDRVREMVRNEQACCAFLTFDLREGPSDILLTIKAPEAAREATEALFEQFVAGASPQACCARVAPSPPGSTSHRFDSKRGTKAAGLTAVTLACGAAACGAACVLPFALPAVALAGMGSVLAIVADAHRWLTMLAVFAVVGAWGWIVWQSAWTRCRPAASTLCLMGAATALLAIAVLWPSIEPALIRTLLL